MKEFKEDIEDSDKELSRPVEDTDGPQINQGELASRRVNESSEHSVTLSSTSYEVEDRDVSTS